MEAKQVGTMLLLIVGNQFEVGEFTIAVMNPLDSLDTNRIFSDDGVNVHVNQIGGMNARRTNHQITIFNRGRHTVPLD